MNQNDHHLIQKILAGNRQAERTLYEKYKRSWFRLCLRYGKNSTEAEDILQEGLILIFRDLKQFDANRGVFASWSNRVLVNAALRYLKKHQWQQSFANLDEANDETSFSETILQKITAKELTEVIQGLPMGYRVVFNMYAIEGYSHKEIAKALNISVSTSKSQLFKARKALRKQLEILF